MTDRDRRWLLAVSVIVAIVYITVAVRFIDRLDPLTGDEPFYVMTAISMLRDHDLDESNNYTHRDYDEFYPADPLPRNWNGWPAFPRTLPPHPATSNLDGLHTKHGLGLSLLIAIPYELAGRPGAVVVVLVCGVLVAANMYLLARDALAPASWAAAIAVMLAITMPIAPYAALLFPEIPAALLLTYSIRRLAASSNSQLTWLLAGASIGFLPWLHQRFAPTAVVLTGFVLFKLWISREVRPLALALTPIAVGGLSLIAYNVWLYRSPLQNTADHAGFNGVTGTINASFGLLLDAQWGLLIAAPVYMLALVGIPCWYRSSAVARLAILAIAPYLIVVATYRVWWGEWGPPARYLVPIAPFAAGAIAAVISRRSLTGRAAFVGLWSIGLSLMIVGMIDPQRFYHQPNGINNLYAAIDSRIGANLTDYLVAYQPLTQSSFNDRIIAAMIFAVLLTALSASVHTASFRASKSQRRDATHPN